MRKTLALVAFLTTLTLSSAHGRPMEAKTEACASVHAYSALLHRTVRYSVGGHGGDFHARLLSQKQIAALATMRACWKHAYPPAYRVERRAWAREHRTWALYRHLDQITACGEWVVCGVIDNESQTSGYYAAVNAGGCSGNGCFGAYQASGAWWRGACSGLDWHLPSAQHECAYIILRKQGLSAWAGDGAYL